MAHTLPFIGRGEHLDDLAAVLGASGQGGHALVAVSGSAGSGKSRLLDEFELRSVADDRDVRRARAFPATGKRPGELADELDLDSVGADRTTILLIDDAHWADPTSLARLRSLLLGPTASGVLLVVTHRPVDERAAPGLHRLLEITERRGDLRRIPLGPLNAADLEAVAGGPEPEALARRLADASGGVPLALRELVDDLVAQGYVSWEGERLVPKRPLSDWPSARSVRERLAEHSKRELLLVRAAALAGRPIPLTVAAHLLGGDPEDVLDLAEELVDGGLLAEDPGGFRTRTSTEAERLASELGAVRKGRVYGALADAATAAGLADREPAVVGQYRLLAGQWEQAVPLLADAGLEAVSRNAYSEGLPIVSGALEALEHTATEDPDLAGRLLFARARCHRMLGRSDLAIEDAEESSRLLTGDAQMRVLGWRAQIADDEQRATEGEWLTALAELGAARSGDEATFGALLTLRAKMLGRLGLPAEADACLRRGIRLLRLNEDAYSNFLGHWNGAWLAFDRGQVAEARSGFEYCVHQTRSFSGDEWLAQAESWLARTLFWGGRIEEALETHDRALDVADRTDSAGPAFLGALAKAEGMVLLGRHREALLSAQDALDIVLRQIPVWENVVRYVRAAALLGAGEVEAARTETGRALARCPEGADGERWRTACRALLLEIRGAAGEPWSTRDAARLLRELLAARWFVPALRLLIARAAQEDHPDSALGAAALATELGIPMLAARALEAGGSWDDPSAPVVLASIHEMARHVPDEWRDDWEQVPAIAAALTRDEPGSPERLEAGGLLRGHLEHLLLWVGLVPADLRIGPREWSAPLPRVREAEGPRRTRLLIGAGAAALVVVGAVVGVLIGTGAFDEADVGAEVAAEEHGYEIIQPTDSVVGSWTFRGGPERTGVSDRSGVAEFEGLYWEPFCTRQPIQASPAISGSFLYFGGDDGNVYTLDLLRGSENWSERTDGEIRSSPLAALAGEGGLAERASMVFIGSDDGVVRAFTRDGDPQWDFPTGGAVESAPIIADDLLYVTSRDGYLYALTADGGQEVWRFPREEPGEPIRSSPAIAGDLVIFGSDDGSLYAVDRESGEQEWRYVTGAAIRATPVVSEGVVYVTSEDRFVHSVDVERGLLVGHSQYRINRPGLGSPAVADGLLYVPSGTRLLAINLEDGQVNWSLETGRQVNSSPVIAGDLVYVGSDDGNLYAVERGAGEDFEVREPRWTVETGGEITGSPAVADGAIIVGSWDGCVYAIGGTPHGSE